MLRDWLKFLTVRPTEMVVYGSDDAQIREQLDALSAEFAVPHSFLQSLPTDDLKNRETEILQRMVDASQGEYIFMCNLDTLPFRHGPKEEHWLEDVFERLGANEDLAFFSACGLRYRNDSLEPNNRFFLTQRFSNNCGLLRRRDWQAAIAARPQESLRGDAQRFHSEWALEEGYRLADRWGLRRKDSLDWRVFHVQRWDETLFKTRERFLRGVDVEKYLNRVFEDNIYAWERIYDHPSPSRLKLLRIRLGRWRRNLVRRQSA